MDNQRYVRKRREEGRENSADEGRKGGTEGELNGKVKGRKGGWSQWVGEGRMRQPGGGVSPHQEQQKRSYHLL